MDGWVRDREKEREREMWMNYRYRWKKDKNLVSVFKYLSSMTSKPFVFNKSSYFHLIYGFNQSSTSFPSPANSSTWSSSTSAWLSSQARRPWWTELKVHFQLTLDDWKQCQHWDSFYSLSLSLIHLTSVLWSHASESHSYMTSLQTVKVRSPFLSLPGYKINISNFYKHPSQDLILRLFYILVTPLMCHRVSSDIENWPYVS